MDGPTFVLNRLQLLLSACRYRVRSVLALAFCALIFAIASISPALSQERTRLTVSDEVRYGRLVLEFPSRRDLPIYEIQSDNGVLSIIFDQPISVEMPDISGILSKFVTVARLDPDGTGIRLGMRDQFRINTIEAGERLFVDILQNDWQGEMPGLPTSVIAELSKRSQVSALEAERLRKANLIATNRPEVKLHVGRHPTFVRLQFDWSLNVEAKYEKSDLEATVRFSLPLPIDLYDIKADLPAEIVSIDNSTSEDDSTVVLALADGVVPRFYSQSSREYVIDIDLPHDADQSPDIAALLPEDQPPVEEASLLDSSDPADASRNERAENRQVSLKPTVEATGSTLRVVFPFEADTPAAVFRRGDKLWMIFDTTTKIQSPESDSGLEAVADNFDVVTTEDAQIVRVNLVSDRLATLASEGRAWVLSMGDILLSASEPTKFSRIQDESGAFSMIADLPNASRVHEIRDPVVGDVLQVVTAYPPSRSVTRTLEFVDFAALRSVHGLVIKALNDELKVAVNEGSVLVSAERGLIVSPTQVARATDATTTAKEREGFVDLRSFEEPSPPALHNREVEIMHRAAQAQRRQLDPVRLELARFYVANQLSYEALGVLEVLSNELTNRDFAKDIRLTQAAALVASGRAEDALDILNKEEMAVRVDALLWRTIARANAQDFVGARSDALAAEVVYEDYPTWVQNEFLFAGIHAALETRDSQLAVRYLGLLDHATLSQEELTLVDLYSGWLDEIEKRLNEALDTYGRVIAADIRPTRALAIYRTLLLLDKMGRLDPARAAETLAVESMVWRGDLLEVKMLKLLTQLFIRAEKYRDTFETVKLASISHPGMRDTDEMLAQASEAFSNLFLNGYADSLDPVEALTLYYDYRQFTPPGSRGDEMIRNLARRLVRVDLLDQAAQLLEYQIENRLQGAAKAQIASDLAIIYIAARKPDLALRALNVSRVNGLPPALERQRRILEARSLVDANREDLALDLLQSMDGRDADLLRVDAHWKAKRYRDAGELLEVLYAPNNEGEVLTPAARTNLVRAAVGFVLADDQIALSRLRSKFGERMATTPEWALFNFVTGPIEASSVEFRKVAQEVADVDSLNAFLTSYRQVYESDGALAPTKSALGNI